MPIYYIKIDNESLMDKVERKVLPRESSRIRHGGKYYITGKPEYKIRPAFGKISLEIITIIPVTLFRKP